MFKESPFLINYNKTVFIHIPEFLQNMTSTLDFKRSSLFGGTLANFFINNRKKIFTVSYRDYSYLEYELIPTLKDDKILFVYLGNNLLNSSPMPGFKRIQNLILSSKFIINDTIESPYPFSHVYRDELYNICIEHYTSVSYSRDEDLSSQSNYQQSPLNNNIPKPTLSTTGRLLDYLLSNTKLRNTRVN